VVEVDIGQVVALVLSGAGFATLAIALSVSVWRRRRERPIADEPSPLLLGDERDATTREARIAHIQELMTSQDSVTWTVAGISFAAQAALAAFFFQRTVSGAGEIAIPVAGVWAAVTFGMLVLRSNWYMGQYIHILRDNTHREEYRLRPPEFPPSATAVVDWAHVVIAFSWLVLLMWVVLVGALS
jgi:hypothetical protein